MSAVCSMNKNKTKRQVSFAIYYGRNHVWQKYDDPLFPKFLFWIHFSGIKKILEISLTDENKLFRSFWAQRVNVVLICIDFCFQGQALHPQWKTLLRDLLCQSDT